MNNGNAIKYPAGITDDKEESFYRRRTSYHMHVNRIILFIINYRRFLMDMEITKQDFWRTMNEAKLPFSNTGKR